MACFRISISMDLKSTMLHTRCTKNPDIVCFHLYEISKVEKWEDGRLIGCLYSVRDVTANIFRFSAGVMEIPKLTMGRVYACQHIKIHQMYFK